MKILIKLPTWLGDAVMVTPALELLHARFPEASFTYMGSKLSCALFERDTRVHRLILDDSKGAASRIKRIFALAQEVGKHDIAITFQNNFLSALLLKLTRTPKRIGYAKELRSPLLTHTLSYEESGHQVERYAKLLIPILKTDTLLMADLIPKLHVQHQEREPFFHKKKVIGINPGASYGSAKKWPEEYFASLIDSLIKRGAGIVLFGGESDKEGNERILALLAPHSNALIDRTAQTTINDLIDEIGSLDLFITNDSGPMHLAAALEVPLIALFGPTNREETSPWRATNTSLLSKDVPCSPCKKRTCPLGHHECMRLLLPKEVLTVASELLSH